METSKANSPAVIRSRSPSADQQSRRHASNQRSPSTNQTSQRGSTKRQSPSVIRFICSNCRRLGYGQHLKQARFRLKRPKSSKFSRIMLGKRKRNQSAIYVENPYDSEYDSESDSD